MSKIDLGWGNSVAVREAFLQTYHRNPMQFGEQELMKFDYPTHEGDPKLVEITKQVVERQTGHRYKHLFLVNGATGGCVISMRAFSQRGYEFCMTRKAPFYVRYPKMIETGGLKQIQDNPRYPITKTVALIDLPSNPLGLMSELSVKFIPIIIDGVYLSNVYISKPIYIQQRHDIMVGSYSKLLGINGIRVGWVATDEDLLAERLKELVTSEYCGLSTASTELLKHTLYGFDWDRFESLARMKLDCNREEFSQLEKFFQGAQVSDIGMFFYGPMDAKAQSIFKKADVSWTPGSALGTNEEFARFNLGQSSEIIHEAVQRVLKADRIK